MRGTFHSEPTTEIGRWSPSRMRWPLFNLPFRFHIVDDNLPSAAQQVHARIFDLGGGEAFKDSLACRDADMDHLSCLIAKGWQQGRVNFCLKWSSWRYIGPISSKLFTRLAIGTVEIFRLCQSASCVGA